MSLDHLKDVYNPLAKKQDNQSPPPSWQDSAPVMRLSEYLKLHKNEGMKLYQSNGKPCLSFDPGLGLASMKTDRWKIATNAIDLLQDAAGDLERMIATGLIELPVRPNSKEHINETKGVKPCR